MTPRVQLQPTVVRMGQHATISISSVGSRSLQVRLVGATNLAGAPLPWLSLHLVGGAWLGTLPAPALRGVYSIEVRSQGESVPFRPPGAFLRVFEDGTLARPSFDDPAAVARWWVDSVAKGQLVALKAWPRPAFDLRETRLHRLFVVAYSPPRRTLARDRLGMFVTAFRDGYNAGWRLLEATVTP